MNKASYGRNGDSLLVHMRPDEVRSLGLLAHAAGTNLTRNPKTGYPEAWSLPPWVLPVAGLAATALTAGAAAPLALGALEAGAVPAAAATGVLGAAGAETAAAAAAPVAAGLTAAETASAAAPVASGLMTTAPAGSIASGLASTAPTETAAGLLPSAPASAIAPHASITEMSSNAGLMDKANYALGNTFSQGGAGANAVNAFTKYAAPVSAVMNAVQSTAPQHNQMPTPSPIMPPTANPALGQLVQSNNQQDYQRMQDEQARREQQRQRIAMIGRF